MAQIMINIIKINLDRNDTEFHLLILNSKHDNNSHLLHISRVGGRYIKNTLCLQIIRATLIPQNLMYSEH